MSVEGGREQAPAEAPGIDEDLGQCFGEYSTKRLLGRGGMGKVYAAEHCSRGELVALKVMNRSLVGEATATERFFREARALEKVRHPHVVRLFDANLERGRPYLAMELLEGETLSEFLAGRGRLPLPELIALFLPILSAVAAIHAAGIVHRDLKLGNVFLAQKSTGVEPIVLDFGISRLDDLDDLGLTRSAAILGTPRYLSPERVLNAKDGGPLADQYSLGVMLYESATGERPFSGGSPYEVMHAILTLDVPPPSALVAGLPSTFDAIVLRAMRRESSLRFRDVRELGSALLSLGSDDDWSGFAREFVPVDGEPLSETTLADSRVRPTGATSSARRSRPTWGSTSKAGPASSLLPVATEGDKAPRPSERLQKLAPWLIAAAGATAGALSWVAREPVANGREEPARSESSAVVAHPAGPRGVESAQDEGVSAVPSRRPVATAPSFGELPAPSANAAAKLAPGRAARRSQVTSRTSAREPGADDAVDPFAQAK